MVNFKIENNLIKFVFNTIVILLTGGGTGFVGRHLRKALQENGFKVTLISRQSGPDTLTWVGNDINRM